MIEISYSYLLLVGGHPLAKGKAADHEPAADEPGPRYRHRLPRDAPEAHELAPVLEGLREPGRGDAADAVERELGLGEKLVVLELCTQNTTSV